MKLFLLPAMALKALARVSPATVAAIWTWLALSMLFAELANS